GLVARGHAASDIVVAEPVVASRDALARDFGVRIADDNADAARDAAVVVLAVKPQVLREVCAGLREAIAGRGALVVSIAAGIRTAQLERWLGAGTAVVRAMPNTPALIGAGASGLYATPYVTAAQRAAAEALLGAAGIVAWIDDEALMDAVTAVSGSGPAYFFLLVEALQAAAEAQGLSPEAARALVVQTALGAARMAAEGGEDAAALRRRVTSPGGTTQAAIETFEAGGFRRLVADAVARATARGRELSQQSGD
ncbi:MAG TPA: pyrroline-5-carboxylate reductase, partial [Xanthomonadales bacterium]|nr:pyrroline-5-carboxylate reductase [Xanthomonadales bacterium]